jgi:lipoprotein-anchoring transpeptidase ErfK/SrfK
MAALLARHRFLFIALTVAIALAAFAAYELVTAPRISAVTPSAGGYSDEATVEVAVRVPGLHRLRDVTLTIDGRPVAKIARHGDLVTLNSPPLSEGSHTVSFTGTSSNVFGRHVSKTWRFIVDTVAPPLTLTRPTPWRVATDSPLVVRGETEPGARVVLTRDGARATTMAGPDGRFSAPLATSDGTATLRLVATDAAGNSTDLSAVLRVDANPPELSVGDLPATLHTGEPLLRVTASDTAKAPRIVVRVDGKRVLRRVSHGSARVRLARLTDGEHTITVIALDLGRNVARSQQTVVVDTTERLGEATLTAGARGKDVLELQRKLKEAGFFRGEPTGVLGRATVKAVKRFQTHMAMTPDGIVGPLVVGALSGRIVVDLSECRLYLYRNGKLEKTYPVAVGQPAYPTPTGDYSIASMIRNPTWIPPDSPWAQGLEPVPPGPGNPVGTRWIGTTAPGVGIHGTPADYSIGTHASHGCIRMHMWDVEDLFERVAVGMPVHIQW